MILAKPSSCITDGMLTQDKVGGEVNMRHITLYPAHKKNDNPSNYLLMNKSHADAGVVVFMFYILRP